MARLGPFEPGPRLALAVSGGADSMAMALLAAEWAGARGGSAKAFIVDHGLRAGSGAEAARVRARLAAASMAAEILTLAGLEGTGLPARARAARHAALAAAAAGEGFLHLLFAHHADDQAETVKMRALAGSGGAGLAGMAAVRETAAVRLLRPLLDVPAAALRGLLAERGVAWEEDPTNLDRAYARPALRASLRGSAEADELCRQAEVHGQARLVRERATAATLGRRAVCSPLGYAVLAPGPIDAAGLRALWWAISGRDHPPPAAAMASLAAEPRWVTLAGVRMMAAGRLGPGWLLVRERASPARPAADGAVWDRFRLHAPGLSDECAAGRYIAGGGGAAGLPRVVRATVPALWRDGSRVPLADGWYFRLQAPLPAAGAAFLPAGLSWPHSGVLNGR